jgi:hypothetical protein
MQIRTKWLNKLKNVLTNILKNIIWQLFAKNPIKLLKSLYPSVHFAYLGNIFNTLPAIFRLEEARLFPPGVPGRLHVLRAVGVRQGALEGTVIKM